jgi:hypothetical protein
VYMVNRNDQLYALFEVPLPQYVFLFRRFQKLHRFSSRFFVWSMYLLSLAIILHKYSLEKKYSLLDH